MLQSLRETQSPESRVDTIIQTMRSPQKGNKVLILVEGKDDKEYYQRFFKSELTSVEQCQGCKPEIELHNYLSESKRIKYFLTIKDADFDRLLNCEYDHPKNLLITDNHDLEISYLVIHELISSLFDDYGINLKDNTIDNIYDELKYLSLYKFYNHKFQKNINFTTSSIVDKEPLDFSDIEKLLNTYKCKDESNMPKEEELNDFCKKQIECCRFQITNGHDFISRLVYSIINDYNKKHNFLSPKNIPALLMSKSIEKKNFQKSMLYKSIEQWQKENKKVILAS